MTFKSFRNMARNVASLLTSQVVNRAATFVVYALVARYLGAFQFGQLTLALTLFAITEVIAGMGLKTLVTREVAKNKAKTDSYLVNGSAIVVVCSLLAMIVLLVFVRLLGYSQETASVILLLSLGVLPFSLSFITEAVFQAWERMHYIAWAHVTVNAAKVGLAFLLLRRGHGLYEVILLLLASYLAILIIEWWLMVQHIAKPHLIIDRRFCITMLHAASPFLGITAIVAISTSLLLLLLSRLASEAEVGIYNAALQLVTPFTLVYRNIMLSVFPEMCRRFAIGLESLKRLSGHVLELMLAISVPAIIGLSFMAEQAFLLLYGDADFILSSPILRILAWTLILRAFTNVLGRDLVAGQKETVMLRIILLSTMLQLIVGLTLIIQFGLIGAAVASLLTALVDFLLHYTSVSRWLFRMPLVRPAWKPTVAGICMAIYLVLVRNQSFLLTAISACIVYAISFLVLILWSNGGLRQFRAKYQVFLSS